jgi:hypothetical protein
VAVDVLLVVDMQEGPLSGAPKHDLLAVVERINHHHWVWANLLAPHPVRIAREAEV